MYLRHKIILGLLLSLNSIFLYAQPITNCPQGTEKNQYGFVNPCSSYIKWDTKPKHFGSVFEFDIDIFSQNSYCIYNFAPSDNEYFDGKVEFTETIKIPIKDRKNLTINLTPCKVNRFYVKEEFSYHFSDWKREFGSYSDVEWKITKQHKEATRTDSILYLQTRKPSFGNYVALLYMEFYNEVDFNVAKLSEYLTGDSKIIGQFYEDYIGKSYKGRLGLDASVILEEYLQLRGGDRNDYFTPISLFFDYYYKEYSNKFPSQNPEALVVLIYNYLNPPFRPYYYEFKPQHLLDKFYGSVSFGFRNETIALEISNPNLKDISDKEKKLSAIVRADFKYQNLPYERIIIKNEQEMDLDSFYLGNGFLKIQPNSYTLDLDIFENDDYHFGYISSFHQQYERDFPPRIHSDEYIQSFMGLYIKQATLMFTIQGENYEFEYARLLIDGTEINGTLNIDFSKFKTPIDEEELVKLFQSNGIETEIPDTYNSLQKTLFFRVK